MKRHFLGKPLPQTRFSSPKKQKRFAWRGATLLSVPFLAFMTFAIIQPQYSHSPQIAQRAVGPAVTRTLAEVKDTPAPADCKSIFQKAFFDDNGNVKVDSLFPFIPTDLQYDSYQKDAKGQPILDSNGQLIPKTCGPSTWDRSVFIYFIFKVLVILNWLAAVLAILLTVWAGIMYIRGYAGEANVTKAKSILLATYIGLAIVFGARLMVYTAVDLFSDKNAQDAIKSPTNIPIDLTKPLEGGSSGTK